MREVDADELADLLVSHGPETQPVLAAPKPHAGAPSRPPAKTIVATPRAKGGNGHPARETRP